MKIVFMGPRDLAASSLKRLSAEGDELSGIVTHAEKQKNRGILDQ